MKVFLGARIYKQTCVSFHRVVCSVYTRRKLIESQRRQGIYSTHVSVVPSHKGLYIASPRNNSQVRAQLQDVRLANT